MRCSSADQSGAGPDSLTAVAQARVEVDERTDSAARLAPLYRVLVHNDDVTTMDFVVRVLQTVFHKPPGEALEIMLTAHQTGVALVAVLPLEHAELKVDQAHSLARAAKFPLTFTCEPEECS